MQFIVRLFSMWNAGMQYCYSIASQSLLSDEEVLIVKNILGEGFSGEGISLVFDVPEGSVVIEIGPRKNFATAWSTNFVSVCRAVGLENIVRAERLRRYQLSEGADSVGFVAKHCDQMTECVYGEAILSFETGISPEATYAIPLIEEGADVFSKFDGLKNLNSEERQFYYHYFFDQERRNPTIVEMLDLLNANSEHSRHGYFKARQVIDGVMMSRTLMELVQDPYCAHPGKSLMAFSDNSSGVRGFKCWTLNRLEHGQPSPSVCRNVTYHIIATAETHNFPTGVAPFPGAETGVGGRIRDIQATGRGGIVGAGAAGYCVGNLLIQGYDLPWERKGLVYPLGLARPLAIEREASNGASDYGNKYGEPLVGGFTRSFGLVLPDGNRWEFLKPIMWTAGIGTLDARHMLKHEVVKGMLIVEIGGPAYRIGFGGGSASSLIQGDNEAHLDFNAVQRGDGEMKQKVDSVLRACIEMGERNPIESLHDQGAGGPANVLKELVEKSGGRVELRHIILGDPTMSAVEIWICEYQERLGLLISPDRVDEFQAICDREKVNCEVLGEVTGDGRFVVHDGHDDTTPVNLELAQVLGGMPQKTFEDTRICQFHHPLLLPETVTVADALDRVLRNLAVSSKGFLVRKVDRSVGGRVARQQCCGPLQLAVADNAIVASSHFSLVGAVTSIGEQPIKMLLDPACGARMAVGEALTNMASSVVSDPSDIYCSANWMWAAKLPGEGAAMWDAAHALSDIVQQLGMVTPNRGKDSLSMATRVGNETVKSGRQLVIYAYAPMPDITRHVTPDIKWPGESVLIHIDVVKGKTRLGGSVLAQVYEQLGDVSPDVDNPVALKQGFWAVQKLVSEGLILSAHDVSDGGLIVTLLEMVFAGNCGLAVDVSGPWSPIERLFAEELGWVVECGINIVDQVLQVIDSFNLQGCVLGHTLKSDWITVTCNFAMTLNAYMPDLREVWEETSYQLERLQMNPICADQEKRSSYQRRGPQYRVLFEVTQPPSLLSIADRPNVAILREEGSNGYREMTAAFYQAGFMPWDITMTDLLEERINFDGFKGLVAVGGFSYADVPASAKGWAATIRFHPILKAMFERFYAREDTFSLGICNGCQLFALLGVVPWSGIADNEQPRFVHNDSGRFESRWSIVRIMPSQSIMLGGMEESVLGVWTAHGEGNMEFPNVRLLDQVITKGLAPVVYVDDTGEISHSYPFNPNGSPYGIAGLCTPDGRHLAMMPHPERSFLNWQWPWMPDNLKSESGFSPWLQMFINARLWCDKT